MLLKVSGFRLGGDVPGDKGEVVDGAGGKQEVKVNGEGVKV